jgi:TonB family protein
MKPRSSPVQLAFACNEKFDQMIPCDNGRFCTACSTVVHDLTHKTNQEILELLSQQGTVCGKITRSQLQSPTRSTNNLKKIITSVFITLGLSGLSKTLFAQDLKFKPEIPDSTINLDEGPDDQIGIVTREEYFFGVIVEKKPEYKYGGEEGLRKFLGENLVYPKDSVEGKVFVTFTVDTFGKVTNVKVPRSLSADADKEAMRVIQMLEFIPGEIGGRPTKVNFMLPIIFVLK